MASRINVVQGDTTPDFIVSMLDEFTDGAVDLTAGTVSTIQLFFMAQGSSTVLDTLIGTPTTGFLNGRGQLIQDGYSTPGSGGRVSFSWNPTTLQVPSGIYVGSIKITYTSGKVRTVPKYVYFLVRAGP